MRRPSVERADRALKLANLRGRHPAVGILLALNPDTERHDWIDSQVALNINAAIPCLAHRPELKTFVQIE